MKRLLFIALCASALGCAASALLLNLKVYEVNTREPYTHSQRKPLGDLPAPISIRQYFVSEKNNLGRIDLAFARELRRQADDVSLNIYLNVLRSFFKSRRSGLVQFELYDEHEALLSKRDFDGAAIDDKKYMPICFTPITNAAHKKYYFQLSTLTGNALDDLSLMLGPAVNPENRLVVNKLCLAGSSMTFMTFTSGKYVNYDALLDRISQYKPWLFKKPRLYFLLYLYGAALIFLILYLLKHMREEDGCARVKAL